MIYCNQELGHKASQRASEPCERKIGKIEKAEIRKTRTKKKLTVVNECLTPKSA